MAGGKEEGRLRQARIPAQGEGKRLTAGSSYVHVFTYRGAPVCVCVCVRLCMWALSLLGTRNNDPSGPCQLC